MAGKDLSTDPVYCMREIRCLIGAVTTLACYAQTYHSTLGGYLSSAIMDSCNAIDTHCGKFIERYEEANKNV